jgi:hypothetical protein
VDIRCWWCGVEPNELVEVREFGGTVRYIPNWPQGDHRHAEQTPTPNQLADEGLRMMEER